MRRDPVPENPAAPLAALEEYQRLQGLYETKWGEMSEPILRGYADRHARAMRDLEGLGETQRKDLHRRYDKVGSNFRQEVTGRGLAGSTGLQGTMLGVEAGRNKDLRRLEDQLTRERLGYDATLSGESLAAQRVLGVGGFEAGVRHPSDQFARAKERISGNAISGTAAMDAGTLQILEQLSKMGFMTDANLQGLLSGIGGSAQFEGGASPWQQFSNFLSSTVLAPQSEEESPDYATGALAGAGTGATAGAVFGPWGAGIGAGVGAGLGLLGA